MILLKFEKYSFNMFTNNNLVYNLEMEVLFSPPPTFEKVKLFIFGAISSKLNRNIFIFLPLINKIPIWKERKEQFESDNVLDLVWGNYYDERSHIKSYEILYNKL